MRCSVSEARYASAILFGVMPSMSGLSFAAIGLFPDTPPVTVLAVLTLVSMASTVVLCHSRAIVQGPSMLKASLLPRWWPEGGKVYMRIPSTPASSLPTGGTGWSFTPSLGFLCQSDQV